MLHLGGLLGHRVQNAELEQRAVESAELCEAVRTDMKRPPRKAVEAMREELTFCTPCANRSSATRPSLSSTSARSSH